MPPAPPGPGAEPAPAQSCRQCPGRESPHGGQRLKRVRMPGNLLFLFLLVLFPLPAEPRGELQAPGGGPRGAEPPPPRSPRGAAAAVTPPWGHLRSQPPLRRRGCSSLAGGYLLKLPGRLFIYFLTVLLICGFLKINGRPPPPPVPLI